MIRSEEEVDKMIEEMINKNSGRYITQGISFNKNNERHMEMLKLVLMKATSFSGYMKELLAKDLYGDNDIKKTKKEDAQDKMDASNFLL